MTDLAFTSAVELLRLNRARITPTSATPPFPLEQPHVLEINGQPVGKAMQRSYLIYAFSVLGLPAISIPCGFTSAGLPVGLQIARPWASHRPPVAEV